MFNLNFYSYGKRSKKESRTKSKDVCTDHFTRCNRVTPQKETVSFTYIFNVIELKSLFAIILRMGFFAYICGTLNSGYMN